MSATITSNAGGIKRSGVTVENEPIIKSDGAGSVTQWDNSNADAGEGIYFVEGGSAGDPIRLGVGIAAPIEKLQVAGQVVSTASNSTGSTTGAERSIMDLSDHITRLGHFRGATTAGAGGIDFFVDSAVKMQINAAGAVTIPGALTAGSWTVGSLDIGHGAGGATNTAVGTDALDNSHATAIHNTAIGHDALTGTHTDAADYNTAVGSGSGAAITTGAQNTAVGYQSLGGTLAGQYNVAMGHQALLADCVSHNTGLGYYTLNAFTGSNATAIGALAADAATSAAYLTAVGKGALGALPTGAANTAVGYSAFATLDNTETRNVALGAHAGRYCDATDDSIAIGYGALSGVTWSDVSGDTANGTKPSGNSNIAIGSYALDATTTGYSNVAVGHNAGTAITDGHDHVLIGKAAGASLNDENYNVAIGSEALTADTLSGACVAIGYQALKAQNTANSKNVAIGHQAALNLNGGTDSVYVGYTAGGLGTITGDNNVVVGTGAALNATGMATSVYIGKQAGGSGVITGASNVCIGVDAGYDLTSGASNVLIGNLTGSNVTTGGFNTHLGASAGTAVTTEVSNTYVGHSSGNEMHGAFNVALGTSSFAGDTFADSTQAGAIGSGTTITMDGANTAIIAGLGVSGTNIAAGSYVASVASASADPQVFVLNTAVTGSVAGGTALTFYSRGTLNTAVGTAAGINSLTGDYNTFVGGYAAGLGVVTGDNNVCVGSYSGYDLTGGDSNVMIGKNSGYNATTAKQNVIIGDSACGLGVLANATGGQGMYNVVIGTAAGYDLTTGQSNILMGTDAGANLTDNQRNIAIGHGAMDAATGGEHYNVAIGGGALGSENSNADYCVAIGTDALTAQNGDANVKNTAIGGLAGATIVAGTNNTLLGYSAGNLIAGNSNNTALGNIAYVKGTGAKNTIVGSGAGSSEDGDETAMSGDANVLVGYRAGWTLTTGPGNILIGSDAGKAITEGDYNIAIGESAAVAMVGDSNYNIAIGKNALSTEDGGADECIAIGHNALLTQDHVNCKNLAIGMDAGKLISSGSSNVLIGHQAGAAITGSESTAVGYQALLTSTTGQNTAVGRKAASVMKAGTQNVAVGNNALGLSGTHADASNGESFNTAVGDNALYALNIIDGDFNTALGYNSGRFLLDGSTPVTDVRKCTYIGSSTCGSAATGAENETAIGFGAEGEGTNTIKLGDTNITALHCAQTTITSDRRVKRDITNDDTGLVLIEKLQPVTFKAVNSADYPDEIAVGRYKERTYEELVTPAVEAADEVWEDAIVQEARPATEEETREEVHPAVEEVRELRVMQEARDEEWEEIVHPAEAEETEERVVQEAQEEVKGERQKYDEKTVSEEVTNVEFTKGEGDDYVRTETTETVERIERTPLYTDHNVVNPDGTPCVTVVSPAVEAVAGVEAVEGVEAVAATYYEEGDELPEGKAVGDEKTAAIEAVAAVEGVEAVEAQPEVTEPVIHKCPLMEEYIVQEACDEKRETFVVHEAVEERTERRLVREAQEEIKEEVVVVEAKDEWTETHITRPAEPAREEITERRLVSAAVEAKEAVYETVTVPADERPADDDTIRLGLIAQDVQTAMAEAGVEFDIVNESPNGKLSLKYGNLVMPLIKAVQELSARVKTLEA